MVYALCGFWTACHFARQRLRARGCLDIGDAIAFPFALVLWPVPVIALWVLDDLDLPVIYRRKP